MVGADGRDDKTGPGAVAAVRVPRDPLTPVQFLKGVGPARAGDLARLGIGNIGDVLRHLPRRYEDRGRLKSIDGLSGEGIETVRGRVMDVVDRRSRRGLVITRVNLSDGDSILSCIYFNQPHLTRMFRPGQWVVMAGRAERRVDGWEMKSPEFEKEDGEGRPHAAQIIPIYPATGHLSQRFLRTLVGRVIEEHARLMPDVLPSSLRERLGLMEAETAWRAVHFPDSGEELEAARTRLAFDELFILQTGLALMRLGLRQRVDGYRHVTGGRLSTAFLEALPFDLTPAQKRVISEVAADMEAPHPMNRLVQGDVGSGKTVVAAAALVKAVESGFQGALMVPTEILAEQHFINLRRLFQPLGVKVVLLTGSQSRQEREEVLSALEAGTVQVAVGTHALIQEGVRFRALSLVITDEQHRFGVEQRVRLREKGAPGRVGEGLVPDVLVMTATPIPRTMALTLFGDLDLSIIDSLPPGRKPVRTRIVHEEERGRAYAFVRDLVCLGFQAYVVCPLVEESEAVEARAVTEWVERLRAALPEFCIASLHGRMKPAGKESVMESFRRGDTQILVATTVIEVGVDVPNAAVMVIEGAERFGLAQLHQLRGRVGRGRHESYCLLMCERCDGEGRERLEQFARIADGFEVAEADLALRGPGDLFGTRQHGLPDLKVADPVRDLALMEVARREASALLSEDLLLRRPENAVLRRMVEEKFRGRLGSVLTG